MIFPPDSEILEYVAYEVRTRKIVIEEFKKEFKRDPYELELPELLRAAIIPIGLLPKQNRNSNGSTNQSEDGGTGHDSRTGQGSSNKSSGPDSQQIKSSVLNKIINKYGLVKDERGIKTGPFINDWPECTRELEKEGYKWNKETRHFEK